ncbi:MAG: hypothetical protein R3266_01650 [Gemmatimonadota bacterium]|nr:hypothetical protein [Gemmatimonadota bacterium]
MSQEVFITRAARPSEGSQVPIPEGLWRKLIEHDPDLVAPDEAYPSFVRWKAAPSAGEPWIDWADGNLFTRNADDALLRKLLELATVLRARVRGEDGDLYRLEDGRVVYENAPGPARRLEPEPPLPIQEEERRAERRIAPRLEEILEEAEEPFGPVPENAGAGFQLESDEVEHHAEASFAPAPEKVLESEASPRPLPKSVEVPFSVGDRVRTSWGRPATIVSIDADADDGMGQIDLRYDDGRTATTSCVAHGLAPV